MNVNEDARYAAGRAREAFEDKRFEEALSVAVEAEAAGLVDEELAGLHAASLVELRYLPEAESYALEKLSAYPLSGNLHYSLAVTYFLTKRYSEAIAVCDGIEQAGVKSADVAAAGSASLLKMRRWPEAIEYLRYRIPEFPNDARLHLNLSTALRLDRQKEWGRYEQELAVSLDPSLASKVAKQRNVEVFTAAVTVTVILGYMVLVAAFWPASRYYSIPLWLLLSCASGWDFVREVRRGRARAAVAFIFAFSMVAIGAWAIFFSGPY